MGNEQQARPRQPLTERPVVEGRHDRLAGTGRGHEQVAVMPTLARQLEQLQQRFLKGVRTQLDRTQDHLRAGVSPSDTGSLVVEVGRVVGHEVAARPVALEDRGELGDHVGVAGRRHPDVPLQAGDLGRMGEVRRADVDGREAGLAVEHPGFGMEACRGRVVGDANVGAEVDELIDCRALGRVGVGRREHPQPTAGFAVPAQAVEKRPGTAAADEGDHHIDRVGGFDLRLQLAPQRGLPARVGEQGRVEQWDQRPGHGSRRPVRVATPHRPQDRSRLDRARCGVRRGGAHQADRGALAPP